MEKEFLSQNLCVCLSVCVCVCVCVRVSEFWSQNFGPRILCLEKNFCLITRILCLEKEFLSQNFVCVCLRIFVPEFCVCVSQNFWFFGKRILFCNRNFEKESFFTCQK